MGAGQWTARAKAGHIMCTIHLKGPHLSTSNVQWHLPAGSVYVSDEHRQLDQATCDKIADEFADVLNELLA